MTTIARPSPRKKKRAAPKSKPAKLRTIKLHFYWRVAAELDIEARIRGLTVEEYCERVIRGHLLSLMQRPPGGRPGLVGMGGQTKGANL